MCILGYRILDMSQCVWVLQWPTLIHEALLGFFPFLYLFILRQVSRSPGWGDNLETALTF